MRKFLLSVLLASTVVTPALAQRGDRDRPNREESRSERPEARQERSEARQQARQERSEARQQVRQERVQAGEERAVRVDRGEHLGRAETVRERSNDAAPRRPAIVERRQAETRPNVNERGRPTLGQAQDRRRSNSEVRRQARDSVADWRRDERQDVRQQRIEQRADRGSTVRRREIPPAGARADRPAPLPQTALHRDRRDRDHRWRTDWRNDHRYDWRKHRRHHRSTFRLGFYFDPFGWGYHRYNVGWRLWPSYYRSSYWLNDPYMYRLPYAPWPFKWIRYYDDALLVNTITGQVVDVEYSFFW